MESTNTAQPLKQEPGVGPVKPTYAELTSAQQQRYHGLVSIYGDYTIDIVLGLTNRGKSSYSALIDKMSTISKAKHDEDDYYTLLYEAFPLGEEVTPGDIIRKVGDVRRNAELEPYRSKLKVRCEADFFLLFVFEEHYDTDVDENGKITKTLFGYTPIARVRA